MGARNEFLERPDVVEAAPVFAVFRDDVDLSDVEEEFDDIGGLGKGAGFGSDKLEWLLAFLSEKMLIIEFLLCGLS